jgi:predicted Rossmann-fold nucleotide-binding protein
MGIVADAVLQANGKVIGVIPKFLLDREVGHTGLTSLEIVTSMH